MIINNITRMPRQKLFQYIFLSSVVLLLALLLCVNLFQVFFNQGMIKQGIQWGNTFPSIPSSRNVDFSCSGIDGKPMCCAWKNKHYDHANKTIKSYSKSSDQRLKLKKNSCTVKRFYVPSSYETRHYEKAIELSTITSEKERRNQLLDFMISDIPHANRWLERIRIHMLSNNVPLIVNDDFEYLSRFRVTKTCPENPKESKSWIEWIEPLSIHARHPFAFVQCYNEETPEFIKRFRKYQKDMNFHVDLVSTDYVLLQSGKSVFNQSIYSINDDENLPVSVSSSKKSLRMSKKSKLNTKKTSIKNVDEYKIITRDSPIKKYFFDAGTSTFDSSLTWFTCAYSQRDIDFDRIFGWEYTLLEPNDFWSRVPDHLLSSYQFMNAPVSANIKDKTSAIRILKQVASPDDFVSFKLDIDTPTVELPIVMQMVNDHELSSYIDEFFFELHFRCEVLMYCGWGDNIPQDFEGFTLDRVHTLGLFLRLRVMGIRTHIWP